jgi:hypothetical protein
MPSLLSESSSEEMLEEVKKSMRLPADRQAAKADADPKLQPEYTFAFRWTDLRGEEWSGTFTNRALTMAQKQEKYVLSATFRGGLPYEAFSPEQNSMNEAIAHMMMSLTKRPTWAKDLRSIEDENRLLAIYEEVVAHEAMFLGIRKPQAPSSDGTTAGNEPNPKVVE